jgi:signal peptidase I
MDVHTRPSHSGMFQREVPKLPGGGKAVGRGEPPPPSSDDDPRLLSLYGLLLRRGALAAGLIYLVTEYVADITLCEGPSMSPTLQPAGEIVLLDRWTIRRYGVADGCRGIQRLRVALERQERFVEQEKEEDFWHAERISVSDLDPPTWQDLHQLLTTPLSIGDVVVVEHPSRRGTVCKRVVGLPGDTVLRPRAGLLVLPDGHVWLEGDNPAK